MAKAKKSKPGNAKSTPEKADRKTAVNESTLRKGELRKLNALRKSLGEEIADKAFAEWLRSGAGSTAAQVDKNTQVIADTLGPLALSGKLRIPRGGYYVMRGRGRLIVERAKAE